MSEPSVAALAERVRELESDTKEQWVALNKQAEQRHELEVKMTEILSALTTQITGLRLTVAKLDRLVLVGLVILGLSLGPEGVAKLAKILKAF